jgi:enoyl-CoA hydratase/carnithine racemase
MSDKILLRETTDSVAWLTLNRPAQYNALSGALVDELQRELDHAAGDPDVRVVVIAANGKGFCAGHDLKELSALDREAIEDLFHRCSRMMMTIAGLPKPVLAAVQGVATAAGCQLVAATDLAVASSAAMFATPGVNIGAFCSTPAVALSRVVGRKHAMEMLLTGDAIGAQRAYEMGLVNRVVEPAALHETVATLAGALASKSPQALATGKRLFARQLEVGLEEAYAAASHAIACDFVSADGREGVSAFLDKRQPAWPETH